MRSVVIFITLSLALLETLAFNLFQDFFPDGKYCLIQQLKSKNETKHHQSCLDPIVIRTKYPYLIIWKETENHDRKDDHGVHVVTPESWPDVKSKSKEDRELHFTLHNTSFHMHSRHHHNLERHYMNFTLKFNGLLLVQTVTYKRVQTPSTEDTCTINNILPGKWKYDPNYVIRSKDKWGSCPTMYSKQFETFWSCDSSYHGLQYFPDSNCHVLPLRHSLFLLYHHFHVEGLITNSTEHPYFFYMGDSLLFQFWITSRCEIHSNADIILPQPPYPMRSLVYEANFKWNQFLRNDLPCFRSCADETFLRTEGLKRDFRHDITPCQGCPDGNMTHRYPFDHPEVFYALHELPQSVRVLVLDAGAWFVANNVRGEDSTAIYKETLEALIPHLAYFQKQRHYEVDIYFLSLPGVDPSLAKSPGHEWSSYEEKNRIMYNLFSPQSLAAHNLTVTILPNDELFQRKHLIDGVTNVFLPDNFHYCDPGAFAPDSFLFELIVHNHVMKKLKLLA